ncbi:tetratricopeptide repeat protein [Thiolapillus sp.]
MSLSLHIRPPGFLAAWTSNDLHEEINRYRLPPEEIEIHEGAILTASRFLSAEEALGGIYTSRGDYLTCSDHRRRRRKLAAANPRTIDTPEKPSFLSGRHIYLGWFFNHYGHFMLESLARCWPLLQEHDYDGYIFHLHIRAPRPSSRLFEFLDLLDIPRHKLVFVDRDLQVEELHIPSQQAVLSRALGSAMLPLYQHLGRTAWQRRGQPRHHPRLYLSRRLLADNMRRACNEYLLERHFQELGYEVFHPQLHSPTAQLSRFHLSTHLAGLEGSGLHHVLFAARPEKTWMLCSESRMPDAITQVLLDRHCNSRSHILFQKTPASRLLATETTSFLIDATSWRELGMPPADPDPWSEFSWLRSLAGQLRKQPEAMDMAIRELALPHARALMLDCLLHPENPLPEQALGTAQQQLLRALRLQRQGAHAAACEAMTACRASCGNNPDFLLALARRLLAAGNTKEAIKVLEDAESRDPGNPEMKHLRAQLLIRKEQPEAAATVLRDCLAETPLHFPSLVLLAELLARQKAYGEAAGLLRQALELRPGSHGLYPRLTWYLMQAEDWSAAREVALQALDQQPDNPHSHIHLGRIYLALDEPEKALPHVDQAIRQNPENSAHYRLRARLHRLLGNEEAALRDEQQAE